MDLAKTEMKQEVAKVGKGAGMLGGAGLAGWFLLLFLSFTLMYGLDEVMSRWIAALIVGRPLGNRRRRSRPHRQEGDQGSQPAAAGDAADTQGGRAMGQSTEELNTQIAGTRDNLAADLDALQDRVSPAAIVERRKAAARGRMTSVRNRVMGSAQSARDTAGSSGTGAVDSVKGSAQGALSSAGDTVDGSPLAAGLVAFGAGMLISALLPASDAETRAAEQVVDAAKEHGQPLVDEAKSVGQEVGQQLKESAADSVEQVRSTAADSASRVQDEGRSSAQNVASEAQDR